MSMEMQILVGFSLGFGLTWLQIWLILNWDRIRSFFRKNPD